MAWNNLIVFYVYFRLYLLLAQQQAVAKSRLSHKIYYSVLDLAYLAHKWCECYQFFKHFKPFEKSIKQISQKSGDCEVISAHLWLLNTHLLRKGCVLNVYIYMYTYINAQNIGRVKDSTDR